MDPITSSVIAGIIVEVGNRSLEAILGIDVSTAVENSYKKALKKWTKNTHLRTREERNLHRKIGLLKESIDKGNKDYIDRNTEEFLILFEKELLDDDAANKWLIKQNFEILNRKLNKIIDQKSSINSKKQSSAISKNGTNQKKRKSKPVIRHSVFSNRLDKLKNKGKYIEAVNIIIDNFNNYQSWDLLIELLKFCELESNPEFGIEQFKKFRTFLGNYPNNENYSQKEAINYYLGRLSTQKGLYNEAVSWHKNNTQSEVYGYYQILSSFELASHYFNIEKFKDSLLGYKKVERLLNKHDNNVNLRIHTYLYLATLYTINVIFSLPNSISKMDIDLSSKNCIKFANKANELISKLKDKDDQYDKLAWINCVYAFGEEAKGNIKEAKKYYEKCKELICMGLVTNSSVAHILIYSARFYRRVGEYSKAVYCIKLIRKRLDLKHLTKINFKMYEEASYILNDYGKKKLAKIFMTHAFDYFKKEQDIDLKINWPIVDRVLKTVADYKII